MAKRKQTAMVKWDKELAEAAAASVATVADLGGAGNFFSLQGATLKLGGDAIPGNEMVCIVLDHMLENGYNDTDFDSDNPQSPICYAFGRTTEELKPFNGCESPQAKACEGCELNEWESADKGRGKACKNRARLALISGGSLTNGRFEAEKDSENIRSAQVGYLKVPPTSIGAGGKYVKDVATSMKRPPWAIYTKVTVVPDDKTQVRVEFEFMDKCDSKLAEVLIQRSKDQAEQTAFEYPKNDEAPKKKGRGKKKTSKKKARRRKFT
jgi:hypothetical protein